MRWCAAVPALLLLATVAGHGGGGDAEGSPPGKASGGAVSRSAVAVECDTPRQNHGHAKYSNPIMLFARGRGAAAAARAREGQRAAGL